MMSAKLSAAIILTCIALSTASEWVVETNSFRIKEPGNLQGEYDAAIGDVSYLWPTAALPFQRS